jgi:hypothetical protein
MYGLPYLSASRIRGADRMNRTDSIDTRTVV